MLRARGHDVTVAVATDDTRILKVVTDAGYHALISDTPHPSGSDRVHEAAALLGGAFDLIVNIQGDEPFLDPSVVTAVVDAALNMPDAGLATAARALTGPEAAEAYTNPAAVKVVCDDAQNALYFSRAPIPHVRDGGLPPRVLRHLGIYAWRPAALAAFVLAPPAPLEQLEKLEQLRALALGQRIAVALGTWDVLDVNTPEDVVAARARLAKGSAVPPTPGSAAEKH